MGWSCSSPATITPTVQRGLGTIYDTDDQSQNIRVHRASSQKKKTATTGRMSPPPAAASSRWKQRRESLASQQLAQQRRRSRQREVVTSDDCESGRCPYSVFSLTVCKHVKRLRKKKKTRRAWIRRRCSGRDCYAGTVGTHCTTQVAERCTKQCILFIPKVVQIRVVKI